MDQIRISGGRQLKGRLPISGAKNAALTLLPAALLTDEPLTLRNLPRLADVAQLKRILGNHGVDMTVSGKRLGEAELSGETVHLTARTRSVPEPAQAAGHRRLAELDGLRLCRIDSRSGESDFA